MRKLLAMVATMAMVLSMFSGIAFAEEDAIASYVELNERVYYWDGDDDETEIEITGSILADDDDTLVREDVYVDVYIDIDGDDNTTDDQYLVYDDIAFDGEIEIVLDLEDVIETLEDYDEVDGFMDDYALDSGDLELEDVLRAYIVRISEDNDEVSDAGEEIFYVSYEISGSGSLNFTWGDSGRIRYTGTLPVGTDIDEIRVLDEAGREIALSDDTASGRRFSFEANRKDIFMSEDLLVQYLIDKSSILDDGGEQWVTGLVGAAARANAASSLDLSKSDFLYGVGDQKIELTLDWTDLWFGNFEEAPGDVMVQARFYLRDSDGTWDGNSYLEDTIALDELLEDDDNDIDDYFAHEFVMENLERGDRGTYTARVEVRLDGNNIYRADKTFRITVPGSSNVLGIPDEIELGDCLGPNFENEGYELNLEVWYTEGRDLVEADEIVISASGAGMKEIKDQDSDDGSFILKPKHAGTIELTVKGYDGNKLVVRETVQIPVVGGTLELTPSEVEMETDTTLTINLTDADGQPINNAELWIFNVDDDNVDEGYYPPKNTKPEDGVYTIELDDDDELIAQPGTLTVLAVTYDDEEEADVIIGYATLTVTGQLDYEVSHDMEDGLLAGYEQDVVLTVTEDGDSVAPGIVTLLNPDGEKVDTYRTTKVSGGYEITLGSEDIEDAGTYKIVVSNKNGDKSGSLELEVVLPVLELNVDKITNGVDSEFAYQLVDPRNGDVLDWEIDIRAEYATIYGVEQDGEELDFDEDAAELALSYEESTVTILTFGDFDDADDDEDVPHLEFIVTTPDEEEYTLETTLAIGAATLTADPVNPVLGQSSHITLTLLDANGNPLSGYEVVRNNSKLGMTNENGEYVYVARISDVATFVVDLDVKGEDDIDDSDAEVTLTVTPMDDVEKPVIGEVAAEVNTSSVELVITDNVKVAEVYINGEKQIVVPGPEVKVNLPLQSGANQFHVIVIDSNNNGAEKTFTVNAGSNQIVLKDDSVVRQGEYVYVQVRQFEELGATFAWNGETNTATFTVNGKTVEVTVGSTTAMVDGAAATMPVPPINLGGRVHVPTRFVAEALGMGVHWQPGDIVTITLP